MKGESIFPISEPYHILQTRRYIDCALESEKKIQKKSSGWGEIPKNVIYRAIDLLNVKITINAMWKPVHKYVELTIFGRHVGISTVSKKISCFWNVDAWERRYIDIYGDFVPCTSMKVKMSSKWKWKASSWWVGLTILDMHVHTLIVHWEMQKNPREVEWWWRNSKKCDLSSNRSIKCKNDHKCNVKTGS